MLLHGVKKTSKGKYAYVIPGLARSEAWPAAGSFVGEVPYREVPS
jgi:hypothetical protein